MNRLNNPLGQAGEIPVNISPLRGRRGGASQLHRLRRDYHTGHASREERAAKSFRRGRIVQISRHGTHRPLANMQAEDHYYCWMVLYDIGREGGRGVRAQEDDDSGGSLEYLERAKSSTTAPSGGPSSSSRPR